MITLSPDEPPPTSFLPVLTLPASARGSPALLAFFNTMQAMAALFFQHLSKNQHPLEPHILFGLLIFHPQPPKFKPQLPQITSTLATTASITISSLLLEMVVEGTITIAQ